MAAMLSSHKLTGPFSVVAFILTREQILAAHPTPLSVALRTAPSGIVILTFRSDRCSLALGELALCILKALAASRSVVQQISFKTVRILSFPYTLRTTATHPKYGGAYSLRTVRMSASYSSLRQRPR